ncbi:MAG: HAD family hydrolase [Microbacteriaceae bacterium]
MPEDPPTTPSERPILAFFDVDNTLMRGTSLFQLGREAWNKKVITMRDIAPFVWHQMRFIRKGENMGHLKTAREKALELSSGKQRSEIIELAEGIWQERIQRRLYPGTVELTQEHISKGHEVWLVSATPWEIGDLIARKLGLTGAIGTRIRHEDGVYTGELDGEVMHHEHKAAAAKALAIKAGADLSQSWAYSDSRNDIPLLELVGNPVVVNPDPILAHHAHQNEWPILRFTPKSIREARRRVRREARAVRKEKRRT